MQVAAWLCFNLFEVFFSRVRGEGLFRTEEFSLQMNDFMSQITATRGQNVNIYPCCTLVLLCQ